MLALQFEDVTEIHVFGCVTFHDLLCSRVPGYGEIIIIDLISSGITLSTKKSEYQLYSDALNDISNWLIAFTPSDIYCFI